MGTAAARKGLDLPLVATPARALLAIAMVLSAYVAVSRFALARLHARNLGPGSGWIVAMDGALCVILVCMWLALLAEESRLTRELRLARTGSAPMRALALRQRGQMSALGRFCGSRLGAAAMLLADGDVSGAHDELLANAFLARGGRLERLRLVVEADEARATGSSGGLDRCLEGLTEMGSLENAAAEAYRLHVLVKAVLQKGDPERAQALCAELEGSAAADAGSYLVWLVVWFEEEEGGPVPYRGGAEPGEGFSEGELRAARLLAYAQGADQLVERIDRRLPSVPS